MYRCRRPGWYGLSYFAILVSLLVGPRLFAAPAEVAYSYLAGEEGGVAVARIDVTTGKIVEQKSIYQSAGCESPNKLRRTADRKTFVLSNEVDSGQHLHVIPRTGGKSKTIELPGPPDELRIERNTALVGCGDWLAKVNLTTGKIDQSWKAEDLLTPRGNGPQDIQFVPDGKHVVVSFQKDSKKGTKFGNRLAIFSYPDMQLVADLQLPRNHPETHLQDNKQEQGPGPEVVLVARNSDRILATLDLYGAVLIADWSEALQGKLTNLQVLPTSLDASWGSAFPDRLVEMYFAGQPYVLVCNSGAAGGAVVVSMNTRKLVWKREIPPGMENPIYFRTLHKAYSVCSGKTKRVENNDISKAYSPQPGVFVFDFSSTKAVSTDPVRQVSELFPMHRVTAIPGARPLLLIAGGDAEPDQLVVFDPATETVLDQQPAVGSVAQFEGD